MKGSHRSEEELLHEFSSTGDLDLLGKLYSAYMPLVYGVCLKYLKNRDDAKDSVMLIFEKLIAEVPKQKIENFSAWLHVVTRNFCLMQLRSQKSQQEKMSDWMAETLTFMEIDHSPHPIDENPPDLESALEDCISKLKGEQKECIRLFYYENRCYNEIAGTLGLDEKKVKSYLQNAKRNLKLCLEEKHVGQE